MVTWVFLAAAALAILFAVVAVVARNPITNVLALVVMFFAMAAVFAVIGMDFLAAIQVIVYSGAILVLFLFVIRLLNVRRIDRLGSGRPF
ncbi:MAG: NADH-quinone oxidoreductase subunit J, partial [Acidobacteriota bacterium]|nr:NADH-quinone oxidoreductase subunit J [Acidobacteriota bacterium]